MVGCKGPLFLFARLGKAHQTTWPVDAEALICWTCISRLSGSLGQTRTMSRSMSTEQLI